MLMLVVFGCALSAGRFLVHAICAGCDQRDLHGAANLVPQVSTEWVEAVAWMPVKRAHLSLALSFRQGVELVDVLSLLSRFSLSADCTDQKLAESIYA